jgi:predicted NAD/FAD-binding protein
VRIAIIGSGISGLYAARILHDRHDITLFEAADYPGGHSHTVDVRLDGPELAVDTGFIVFNERNYPLFSALLRDLGVASQPADMSFSMRCQRSGLEYSGSSLNSLYAQRRNLLRASFHRMLLDILRLNHKAGALMRSPEQVTLADFLAEHRLRGPVVEDYLLPMAGAIWSAEPRAILQFPARHFGRFFKNHGLLDLTGRPEWRTVSGGAREYVRALLDPFRDRMQLRTPVEWVRRLPDRVLLKAHGAPVRAFDHVVLACHSDQALRLLRDPTAAEQEILGAIPYQTNHAVLHTDDSLLPTCHRARAAWNYHRFPDESGGVTVTYNLTRLQRLPTRRQVLLTLNAESAIAPERIIRRLTYAHPVYNARSLAAQARWRELNGRNRTSYCGAYWGLGFHEDGLRSGLAVANAINGQHSDEQLHLRRVG